MSEGVAMKYSEDEQAWQKRKVSLGEQAWKKTEQMIKEAERKEH